MKSFIKYAMSSILVLSMVACTQKPVQPEIPEEPEIIEQEKETFTEFLDELFIDELTSDFTTLQQYVEHPENYGIDRSTVEVSLGEVEITEEDIKEVEEKLNKLHSYNYDELSRKEQIIYQQLDYEFTLAKKMCDPKFEYCGNLWGSLTGIHESLITFFSEYTMREEQDYKDLITLINDTPRYVNDALEATKKQADAGTLCFDYDVVLENIQEIIDTKETSSIYNELNDEIDGLKLDDATTKQYKKELKETLLESFFPSYQTIYDTLSSLKDQVKPLTGLANLENGKAYYKLRLQASTGSSESVEQIKENLEVAADSIMAAIQEVYQNNPIAYFEMNYVSTDFSTIDDILPFLKKNINQDFPKVNQLDYELNALSDDQSTEGVVAYCVLPAIDSKKPVQIRYNKRDYGREADSLDLYTTLAHEGLPGHMYQFQYIIENMEHPIEYLFDCLGYTEGYATYVQFSALNYLDVDSPDALNMFKYNELLTDMYIALMDIDIHYYGMNLKQFTNKYSDMFGPQLEGIYTQLADNPTSFLSYYYGYLQIINLKNHAKEELGDNFSNLDFNTALLSGGTVNFDTVAEIVENYINENK